MKHLLTLLLATATIVSSTTSAAQESRVLDLHTNAPSASVYGDELLLGVARQRYFAVPASIETLHLVLGGRDNWSIPPVSSILPRQPSGQDTLHLVLDFPYRYRLESSPYGASVYLTRGDKLLGTTPLELTVTEPLGATLELRLEHYWPEEIEPGQDIWNVHAVRMRPIAGEVATSASMSMKEPKERRKWIDYAALGTAAVAGIVAVHYKFKADRRYDRYRESGDPALRSDVKRFDVYSGAALGVMQAGLGLFAIRLVIR